MLTEREVSENFGKLIVQRCKELGISRRDMADEAGLTEVSVSRYVHGTRTPSLYNAYRVMLALKVIRDEPHERI